MAISEKVQKIIDRVQKREEEKEIVEAERRVVIRGGKKIKKLICPDGFKALQGRCVKMDPTEIITRKRSQKKGARKRKKSQQRALLKRTRSLRKRPT